jgi:hypothetical protein
MKKLASSFRCEEITITYEPLWEGVEPEIVAVAESLIHKAEKEPEEALVELNLLLKKYPNEPRLRNWRLVASNNAGVDREHIDAMIKEDYAQYPDYLFAKCAYAQLCLDSNNWSDIPHVFNNTFTIAQLYPDRKKFFVGEVVAYATIMGQYMAYNKNFGQAKVYFDIIVQLVGECPMSDKIYAVILKNLPEKLMKLARSSLPMRQNKKRFSGRRSDANHKKAKYTVSKN